MLKKSITSALTLAMLVGAASTTFAATNPFSDIPADHWALDACEQLAADGVIEGYGDATFRGDQHITRYEMAQMVAKAMAKKDVSAADKATIDKLAAEFADELNNLGVRVADLEKHADNVKWTGEARYDYKSVRPDEADKTNTNEGLFRLEPSAEVNGNWSVNARLDAKTDLSSDKTTSDVSLKRAWAQGDYKNFQLKAGKMGSEISNRLVLDDEFSGGSVKVSKGGLSAQVEAGRLSDTNITSGIYGGLGTANYQGVSLGYDNGKFDAKASYQNFDWDTPTMKWGENLGIWSVGAGYKFGDNIHASAEYAGTNADLPSAVTSASKNDQKKAYDFTLQYKGVSPDDVNSWGAYASYRYLGDAVSVASMYDLNGSIQNGQKGWQLGAKYVPFKNVIGTAEYGENKDLATGKDVNTLFGRIQFLF